MASKFTLSGPFARLFLKASLFLDNKFHNSSSVSRKIGSILAKSSADAFNFSLMAVYLRFITSSFEKRGPLCCAVRVPKKNKSVKVINNFGFIVS